jgi:class 3 adenylate cyclase
MLDVPDTRYARNGNFSLAYQVLGEGAVDILYAPGFAGNVEGNWMVPEVARFLRRMASFSRLLVVDRRGSGCSDRLPPGQTPTLEDIVDDFRAVLRAGLGGHVFLFGVQDSAFPSMLAAAMYPERFDGLILYSAAPAWRRSEEIPWAWSNDRWDDITSMTDVANVTNATAYTEAYVREALPSFVGDPAAIRRLAMLVALTNAPGAAIAETRKFADVDLRDVLPSIRVPTLVLHRTEDPVEPVESARFLADRIPEARLVELPGADTLPWVGEADAVLDEVERFVTGSIRGDASSIPSRSLATLMFTDIVDSTSKATELGDRGYRSLLESHHRAVRSQIARYRGNEIDTAGDGFFVTFDGPARAIQCASAIAGAVHELGINVRCGVHTGEVETIDGKVGGVAVHIGARIAALADPSEVLVSSTARDLVAGSGVSLEDAGERELKGVPERWRLYRLVGAG